MSTTAAAPNWPPFPANLPWPFKPMFYHNIYEEIPLVNQGDTMRMYQLWKCMPLAHTLIQLCSIAASGKSLTDLVPKPYVVV